MEAKDMSYKEIVKILEEMKIFPLVDGIKNKEIVKQIFPLKQKEVDFIIDRCPNIKQLKSVWVFGSSTSTRCSIYSDLDIAYELEDDHDLIGMNLFSKIVHDSSEVSPLTSPDYDVMLINNCGERLLREIKKGVKIYDVSDRKF